jgi:hypothetical protein
MIDSPSSRVALQVLGLALQQPCPDLLAGVMVTPRVVDELGRPYGELRIHKLVVAPDEARPLVVLGHGNRPDTEVLDSIIGCVGFALQDSGVGIVRLLNLPDDDRLQLAARGFKVKVCLADVSMGLGAVNRESVTWCR